MPNTKARRDVEKYRLLPPLDAETYAGLRTLGQYMKENHNINISISGSLGRHSPVGHAVLRSDY